MNASVTERLRSRQSGVRKFAHLFSVPKAICGGEMLADNFLKALSKIQRTANQYRPPFIAKISRNAEVTMLEM
jgi:hypothetical protein